jgi:Tfp pilus assembly protein PilN
MKKAIGMYFLDTHIQIAQVSWHMGQPTVERTADCPWDRALLHTQSESIAHDIEAVIKREGINANDHVIVGLPGDWISYVPVETDAIRTQDLERFLKFELEDDVPIPFENFQIDMLGIHRTEKILKGMAVVCNSAETEAMCQLLDLAGLNVKSMCPDLAGLEGLIGSSGKPKGVTWALHVHVENMRCLLILSKDGIISMGRSLGCSTASEESFTHDLTLLLREVFTGPLYRVKSDDLHIVASVPNMFKSGVMTAFSSLGHEAVEICDTDVLKESCKPSGVAEQLASTYLGDNPMPNFLASQLTQKQLKKEMHFAGTLMTLLVALLLVIWGLHAFSKIKALRQEQAQLTQEIKAIFSEHVPDVTKIVQPVTQMSNYLDQYRKESEILIQAVRKRARPLQVLEHISRQVEVDRDVSITSIDIEAEHVILEGTTPSYQSVESLADDLRRVPNFVTVQLELGDISTNQTDGQVRFTMSIARGVTP